MNIDNNNNFFRLSCLTEQKSFNGVIKPTLTWTDKANLNNQVKIINSSLKINVSYQWIPSVCSFLCDFLFFLQPKVRQLSWFVKCSLI